ncbi:hypothetical protein ACLBWH_00940 [Sphingomonas sp. M6A6_1c]
MARRPISNRARRPNDQGRPSKTERSTWRQRIRRWWRIISGGF